MSTNVSRRNLIKGAALGMMGAAGASAASIAPAFADEASQSWDYTADVIVLGAGGSGLTAAVKAAEEGASVIVVETNFDCGGHTSVSEGYIHIGGGIDLQVENGIEDSIDLYYTDHTSTDLVVSRLNDRNYVRAIADNSLATWDFLKDNGVLVQDKAPTWDGASARNPDTPTGSNCDSVQRQTAADGATEGWTSYRGKDEGGIGITRPLERKARELGVQFLMNYHMDKIFREGDFEGRVTGIEASHTPHIMPGATEPLDHLMHDNDIETDADTVRIGANKGIIVATGGSTGNLTLRTAFDPRMGPEFDGLAGMPFSDQDGSGELAAMRIGASLGEMANYSQHGGNLVCMCARVGCQYGYGSGYTTESPVWPLVVANGVGVDFEGMVFVNMLGKRFGNEDTGAKTSTGTSKAGTVTNSLYKYNDSTWDWFDAAFGSVIIDDPEVDGDARRYGGPIWAIFDQDECDRNDWNLTQGVVDYEHGYCFKADTLEELAEKVVNKYYEHIKMDPETLVETITNWNSYVDAGEDPEFGVKQNLVYKVENPPFYCAWSMPNLHDTHTGLRVNAEMQVVDIFGNLIDGLYCCGESCGGQRSHGHGRVLVSAFIAGRTAAAGGSEDSSTVEETYYADYDPSITADYDAAAEEAAAGSDQAEGGDGTYTGTSENGQNGQIKLEITVEGGALTAIEVTAQAETPDIGGAALPTLVEEALAAGSADIDAVTGATVTSKAFCEALTVALGKAGL